MATPEGEDHEGEGQMQVSSETDASSPRPFLETRKPSCCRDPIRVRHAREVAGRPPAERSPEQAVDLVTNLVTGDAIPELQLNEAHQERIEGPRAASNCRAAAIFNASAETWPLARWA